MTEPSRGMGMSRYTVAGLMGAVGLVALGLAAVRVASPLMLDLVSGVILMALALGLLGVVVGAEPRPGWRGFALFGWGYFLYVVLPWQSMTSFCPLPTERTVRHLVDSLQPRDDPPARPDFASPYEPVNFVNNLGQEVLSWPTRSGTYVPLTAAEAKAWNDYKSALSAHEARAAARSEWTQNATSVCHLEIALVFALFGSVAGRFLARNRLATASVDPADGFDHR